MGIAIPGFGGHVSLVRGMAHRTYWSSDVNLHQHLFYILFTLANTCGGLDTWPYEMAWWVWVQVSVIFSGHSCCTCPFTIKTGHGTPRAASVYHQHPYCLSWSLSSSLNSLVIRISHHHQYADFLFANLLSWGAWCDSSNLSLDCGRTHSVFLSRSPSIPGSQNFWPHGDLISYRQNDLPFS
jgi:hypothetical protein